MFTYNSPFNMTKPISRPRAKPGPHPRVTAGERYERLFVLREIENYLPGNRYYACLCDCGVEVVVRSDRLRRGESLSCGCLGRERRRAANTTHGLSHHPLHALWTRIHGRCNSIPAYRDRGITVCEDWTGDPEGLKAFMEYVETYLGNKPSASHSLDRINNDGNYEPGNIRWATPKEQANNRRDNIRKANRPRSSQHPASL